jgi:serine/threonine protein kinase
VDSTPSQKVIAVLQKGQMAPPGQREPLPSLAEALNELAGDKNAQRPLPPARFWSEGQQISFHQRDYQIVSKLGEGNIGTTFKVVEIDRSTQEELGTYVAKVIHQKDASNRILRAYRLAKSHLRHRSLSLIHEVANEWQENSFAALMTWVSGVPLADYTGVFSLLAEEQQDPSAEALALRWLTVVCTALEVLHRNGLLHGDVSPRNLIVEGDSLVLTDYDFVHRIEETAPGPGTLLYQPSYQQGQPTRFSDDIYALATSFFHVVFDKKPFDYCAGQLDKTRGLNWEGIDHAEFPILADFLNRATHPQADQRFASTHEALAALSPPPYRSAAETLPVADVPPPAAPAESPHPTELPPGLSPQKIKWLLSILQSYPGSRWGNSETRGLDTDFAASTYVKTDLEELLLSDIRSQRVQLVILCGNAGDGKTALLQHLAAELGFGNYPSARRVLNHTLADGTLVNMNLDGSAAWLEQSADQILDEFLEPFQQGRPAEKRVSLLAINDGRLFEWIEGVERRKGGRATPLTELLYKLLQKETVGQESYVRFVNLNQRSLVGSPSHDGKQIETTFLNGLIDQLYGGAETKSIWLPCLSCSAQPHCSVFQTARLLGPATFPMAAPPEARTRARERLTEAFQAVHLRGETHITVREVRAALVYILFGTEYCSDYHEYREGVKAWPYWERAFAADSPARQGELLRDLVRFDPALETHPQVDRQLRSKLTHSHQHNAPRYPDLPLASARRRAFFEWSANDIEQVTQHNDSLDLARGRYLRPFRNLPLEDDVGRQALCESLCRGIARLEDLPPQALERPGVVPLRITPRTPTETAFWVEKPLTAFRLEADLPPVEAGIERLHRQASLVYTYRDGRSEKLRMGAELFYLLMELADGYQLGDVSTDDTFTQLSIFVQRLVREDERSLFAWNPMQDATIYQVAVVDPVDAKAQQRLVIKALGEPQ